MDRYSRIVAWATTQPWALQPEKLADLRALVALKAAGLTLTDEEIKARIGTPPAAKPTSTAGAIAVVNVHGVIAHRANLLTETSGGTSTEALSQTIQTLARTPEITAIVLDVNSPGGGVFGMPELAQTIREARASKRVVAVANAQMASAAYWLGSAASELVITPSGQVGSIGVFALHEDHSAQLDEAGVKVSVISAGKHKAERLPFAALTEDARAAIQKDVDTFYGMFVRDVAQGRQVTVAAVRSGFGEGRMVQADEALEAGMVDRIATLDEVVDGLQSAAPARPAPMAAQIPQAFTPSADYLRRKARYAALTAGGKSLH